MHDAKRFTAWLDLRMRMPLLVRRATAAGATQERIVPPRRMQRQQIIENLLIVDKLSASRK
jgi:hypothetical protein